MDEYLHYMKTLRSQMNDVEDQAAMSSVEEQTLITTIQTLEKDLDSAKCETKQLKEETYKMFLAKGQICSQILEKQHKIASLELDTCTLLQTLELIHQEVITLSKRIAEKRTLYTNVTEDINSKLQEQQKWIDTHRSCSQAEQGEVVKDQLHEQRSDTQELSDIHHCTLVNDKDNGSGKELIIKMSCTKSRLDGITEMKYKLVSKNNKIRKSIEKAKQQTNDFPAELRAMDMETLDEEQNALTADKAGETEFLQSLQGQIEYLTAVSHGINCVCGEDYTMQINTYAQTF